MAATMSVDLRRTKEALKRLFPHAHIGLPPQEQQLEGRPHFGRKTCAEERLRSVSGNATMAATLRASNKEEGSVAPFTIIVIVILQRWRLRSSLHFLSLCSYSPVTLPTDFSTCFLGV